jgi:hypothetical protein
MSTSETAGAVSNENANGYFFEVSKYGLVPEA